MLLEQELTIVDETSLLMVVNNDWTMIVDRELLWCEQWLLTTVVEGVQHNIVDRVQYNKLLKTLIKLFIFARVDLGMLGLGLGSSD